ncbi:MAG: phosphotransferase, partial [Desulfobacterales bacterium]
AFYWKDIGTPERYKEAVFREMASEAFDIAFPDGTSKKISRKKLKGDGSDRRWYRLSRGNHTMVMVDHGIRMQPATNEADAFIAIGNHLFAKGIPVPKIFLHDAFSGLIFLEDLGDDNLQTVILNTKTTDKILSYYQSVIDHLINLFVKGNEDFDPAWTYQTTVYDQEMILEKECRYFVDAFLRSYLGLDKHFNDYAQEFTAISKRAVELSSYGFMHRDVQSRNIMVKNNRFYFIDFQGGRQGPIQYDLASLLIDPYVALPRSIQDKLIAYCMKALARKITIEPKRFLAGYTYCALTRNLQILGAFGYLSQTKGKKYFATFIPRAIATLKHTLFSFEGNPFAKLTSTIENIL